MPNIAANNNCNRGAREEIGALLPLLLISLLYECKHVPQVSELYFCMCIHAETIALACFYCARDSKRPGRLSPRDGLVLTPVATPAIITVGERCTRTPLAGAFCFNMPSSGKNPVAWQICWCNEGKVCKCLVYYISEACPGTHLLQS